MNFNTLEFILLFIPIVLLLFHSVPIVLRVPVLMIASLAFYGASGGIALVAMLFTVLWVYCSAFWLVRWPSAWLTLLAVAPPLLVLYLFKYLGFSLDAVGAGDDTRLHLQLFLSITLPAGISFYTFQALSYSLDVADRRETPEKNFFTFVTYVSAFPQLIAGPIVRFGEMRDQLHRLASEPRIGADFATGLKFFSIGLFMKTVVADASAALVRVHFHLETNTSSLDALYATLSYSFRIYYDFWAYSVMAIGLGKMIGINLPRNFLEPYLSRTPREFWRRWHVTLSYFLRDYVYIKLGGNRRYVINILIVFLLCGLWHGAGWNFVLWGAYHGLLVVLYHLFRRPWDRLPGILQIALTFMLVSLGWPLFQYDLDRYVQLLGQLFSFSGTMKGFGPQHWVYLGAIAGWTFLSRESRWLYNPTPWPVFNSPVVHAGLLCLSVLLFNFRDTFIYFRF